MSESNGSGQGELRTTPTFGQPWPEFNDGLAYRDLLRSSDSGLTLIEFYSSKHKNSAPLQGWLQRIENGQIKVDGTVIADPTMVLRAGSELVYHRRPWKEPDAPYLLQVLFEDDHLVALNKPSGLQVLPGGLFQQRTVLTQLQWRSNKQGSSFVHQESHPVPVHRLGRGTSGKPAMSKVHVVEKDVQSNHTVVQVEIQSGRPHQIRIHLSFIGHPLIGDPLYVTGGQPKCSIPETIDENFAEDGGYHRPANPVPGDCGYYLHAHQLVLSHPKTNEVFKITAPLPSIFRKLENEGNK